MSRTSLDLTVSSIKVFTGHESRRFLPGHDTQRDLQLRPATKKRMEQDVNATITLGLRILIEGPERLTSDRTPRGPNDSPGVSGRRAGGAWPTCDLFSLRLAAFHRHEENDGMLGPMDLLMKFILDRFPDRGARS